MFRLLFSLFLAVLMLALPLRASAGPNAEEALQDGEVDPEDLVVRARTRRGTLGLAPGGGAWLSLVGFSRKNVSDQQEVGGVVVLGLPLDKFARQAVRGTPQDSSPRPMPIPTQAAPSPITTESAEILLTPRLARACVGAAWRAAGIGADDARLEAIVSRARWAALLPEARVRAVRFEDERLSMDTSTDTTRLRDATGANIGFEARLTWRLDRLVYADDEPAFERMKLERHDARARVAGRTLEALFHWQRAWLELRSVAAKGTRDEMEAALKLMESEAALDVLTGGWFSAERPQRTIVLSPQIKERDL